jgi:hypothetical protein
MGFVYVKEVIKGHKRRDKCFKKILFLEAEGGKKIPGSNINGRMTSLPWSSLWT